MPKAKQNELSLCKKPKIKIHITGTIKITLELSSELNKKLQKVLDLKSHAIPDRNVLTLFEKLLDAEIKKYEGPKKKSQAVHPNADQDPNKDLAPNNNKELNRDTEQNPSITSATNVSADAGFNNYPVKNKRKHISIIIKRRVYQKAGNQCEYISPVTGQRCPQTRFLTLDHIMPLALGGTNKELNYSCKCSSHNLAEAKRMGLKIPKPNSKNLIRKNASLGRTLAHS